MGVVVLVNKVMDIMDIGMGMGMAIEALLDASDMFIVAVLATQFGS